MWIFWTYFTKKPPQCKMSRKFVHQVPGCMGRANGRMNCKKRRRIHRHGNANSHICNFANALKKFHFSVSYKLCIMWNKNISWETKNDARTFHTPSQTCSSFYYYAVLHSFSHKQLFQFKIYRYKQAESHTNFCYLTYWKRTESIISIKFHCFCY